jgi:hypothetical protein
MLNSWGSKRNHNRHLSRVMSAGWSQTHYVGFVMTRLIYDPENIYICFVVFFVFFWFQSNALSFEN